MVERVRDVVDSEPLEDEIRIFNKLEMFLRFAPLSLSFDEKSFKR